MRVNPEAVVRPSHGPTPVLFTVIALAIALLPAQSAAQDAQPDELDQTISIVKADEQVSAATVAGRLSEISPGSQRVIITRDDNFADALASSLLQRDGALLVTPSQGPLAAVTRDAIRNRGATDAIILGGELAVSAEVESELTALGISVSRRAGTTRFDTAIEIARSEAPDARTAIIARAFATNPDDPTQAFADTLAGGGLAAENGWPVLLSDTGGLTPATRQYLESSDIDQVVLLGGTAALSQAVETELREVVGTVDRVAGPARADTAIEIAKARDADSAADVARVVLVDGTATDAWVGGFAAAGHSAATGAPIVVADGIQLPPATQEWMDVGDDEQVAVTCVSQPLACEAGRQLLGLPTLPVAEVVPARDSLVQPGQELTVLLRPASEADGVEVELSGSCLAEVTTVTADTEGRVVAQVGPNPPPICTFTPTVTDPGTELISFNELRYVTQGDPLRDPDDVIVRAFVNSYGQAVPEQLLALNVQLDCDDPVNGPQLLDQESATTATHLFDNGRLDRLQRSSNGPLVARDAACTVTAQGPPEARRILWGLYSDNDVSLRFPLALGQGDTAEFDVADVPAETADLAVRFIVELDDPRPSAPQPAPEGQPGLIAIQAGTEVVCDGQTFGPGLIFANPQAVCTARALASTDQVLVAFPDRLNQVGRTIEFNGSDDTRTSIVTAIPRNPPPPD